ncbi:hypothetical protein BTN50_0782 [Candidatus Enterovibrio altilux]|uniref:Uncharacterized protein n=1 Tax=Candidatus Enterovibrio altilux TaxID=1927128 RepID=A0A291B8I4_9GAMM|nr:hypothetical protein BTN50_0782 [Candidatus Enterovibrio luxaltus]
MTMMDTHVTIVSNAVEPFCLNIFTTFVNNNKKVRIVELL